MAPGALGLRSAEKTLVMGIINATPDSFYPESRIQAPTEALEYATRILAEGADLIDVGGESSRPHSQSIGLDEELQRVLPVLEALSPLDAAISIDTYRAETARRALHCGASLVNDITALRGDPKMASVIAEAECPCILMHMQGNPSTMQEAPAYEDVIDDLCAFFEERIAFAVEEGISEAALWLDPGFGFGKTVAHNLEILRRLDTFGQFGLPVVIGTSNKSTIGAVLNLSADERMEGTAATVAIAIWNGAACIRVHDVKAMARVARMVDAIKGQERYE
ncbi:MAG: dihydropteroate synthase [Candidatus Hydrogenedentes bacterium]|nr:dihydropteroate synthase [Candidatus Hydrogenedentota bacterium]